MSNNTKIKEANEQLDQCMIKYKEFLNTDNYLEYNDLIELNIIPKLFKPNIISRCINFKEYFMYRKKYLNVNKMFELLKNEIEIHNNKKSEKNIDEFNNVCGLVENIKLDKEQLDAVVHNEKNQLVLAGADSGKTTTIIGKVKYLIKVEKVSPNDILLLSFTNNSIEELKRRIINETGLEIDILTFHKLGLEIIKNGTGQIIGIYNKELSFFIKNKIDVLSNNNFNYLNKLISFVISGKYKIKEETEFANFEEYNCYLLNHPPITILGENVKSYGEMEIANFLYTNSIKYEYEKEYKYKTIYYYSRWK